MKNNSLKVSEAVFKKLEEKLGDKHLLNGFYDTFNNCRESGLVLTIYDNNRDNHLCIWACESGNSDQIMIVIGNEKDKDANNMFDDEAYNRAKYFECNDYDSAIDYVYKQIKFMFKNKMNREKHFKFDCYYSIEDIQRINVDANILEYEDYHELASFYDENENYSCDLVINNGKMGLQYNKYEKNRCEKLIFEEADINLDDKISMMLDMQKKLDKFISDELEYNIEMNSDIRI